MASTMRDSSGDQQAVAATPYVLDFSEVGAGDVALVGGKCASLGELFRELTTQGVRAVDGFSTTSHAYELLIEAGGIRKKLQKLLKGLDTNDMDELLGQGIVHG